MDRNRNMVRIFEGGRAALERGVIEIPFRRSLLPDQLRKIVPVLVVAFPAAFGREIKLIPPFEFRLWRQRNLARFLATDQITAHGNERFATFRPERPNHIGRSGTPNKTGEDRLVDLESIHQRYNVGSNCRRLAISKSLVRKKSRRAVAAQIRNNDSITFLG